MSDDDIRTWYPEESGGRPVMILVAAGDSYETSDEAQFVQHSDYVSRIAAKDAEIAELRKDLYFTKANISQLDVAFAQQRSDWAKAITERDEARECVGRLYKALCDVACDQKDFAFVTGETMEAAGAALAATPEHLR